LIFSLPLDIFFAKMPRRRRKDPKKPSLGNGAERLNHDEVEMRKMKEPTRMTRERRRESRINEEDKVVIELLTNGQTPDDMSTINALTKDISPGGVRIMTNLLLPVDTPLKMEIVLSQRRRRIHTMGVVRWARSVYEEELFEMGIEFSQISAEDKMLLLEHTYRKRE
jgi:c-di-GMP-binding flagellar brake protein YcgR